ncbi:hypothetical protein CMS34_22910 [Salmonella enterica]|nr:hypothetical protein [Salmonella enterica]
MAQYRMINGKLIIKEPKRSPIDGLTKAERRQQKRAIKARTLVTEPTPQKAAPEKAKPRKIETADSGYSRQRMYADFALSSANHLREI